MPRVQFLRSELFDEYRRGVERETLPRALRTAVFVFFVIQTLFIGVDWLVYNENSRPLDSLHAPFYEVARVLSGGNAG